MRNAEQFGEFGLEMPERAKAGTGGIDVVECAGEQIVKRGVWVFWLDRRFQKLAAISSQQGGAIVPTQSLAPMANGDLPQCVKITAPRFGVSDFAAEKEVKFPGKRAFWT